MTIAKDYDAPIAIRYPRGRINEGDDVKVIMGKGVCLRENKDAKVAVLTLGAIGQTVIEAIDSLEAQGERLKARIVHYDMRWLKPMDESILTEVAETCHTIITVEDGVISGGLGSAVAEFILDYSKCKMQNAKSPHLIRLGVNDQFVEHGSTKELYHLLKLDKEGICESLLQALEQ
jgi:1-deoxy-D-xylulose-5-phosphate synthase